MHRVRPARINDASIIDASMMHRNGSKKIDSDHDASKWIDSDHDALQLLVFLQLVGFGHTLGQSVTFVSKKGGA